jgi:hypothetical protein
MRRLEDLSTEELRCIVTRSWEREEMREDAARVMLARTLEAWELREIIAHVKPLREEAGDRLLGQIAKHWYDSPTWNLFWIAKRVPELRRTAVARLHEFGAEGRFALTLLD